MNESVRLQLPMGFRMEDRVERLPLQDAERKLWSKKWRYYTNAQRQGEGKLVKSYLLLVILLITICITA